MASWLKSVQDKLENVANSIDRVVQEAASEVTMNPEVEIEVEKQRCVETERQLLIEQKRADDLQKRVEELEEQLYSTNIENDAIKERFQKMITSRDEQIKRYERELENLQNWAPHDDDDDDKLARLKEENAKLKKEINEWKKVAHGGGGSGVDSSKLKDLQDEIRRLKEKHTEELADITYSNQQLIAEVRQEYESLIQKIKDNQSPVPRLEHKSESEVEESKVESNLGESSKVNPEFMREMSESLDEIKEENVQLTRQIKELEEKIHQLMSQVENQKSSSPPDNSSSEKAFLEKETDLNREIERLKAINAEMAVAYNDLNSEFEAHKAEHGSVMHANSDLVSRIDSLKANLIEYEERYELCKAEHNKTVAQLEKLTSDFERLRSNFQITKQASDKNEEKMKQEMGHLKESLEKTKQDRDNFRTEVKSFRDSVSSISAELDRLRANNQKVMADNVKLAESLSKHESVQEMLKESNEELVKFRERFNELQQEYKDKIHNLETEKAELEERIQELEDQLNSATSWEVDEPTTTSETIDKPRTMSQSFTTDTQTDFELLESSQKTVLEEEIQLLRQQVDVQNQELERLRSQGIEDASASEELDFLKKAHEEEVIALQKHIEREQQELHSLNLEKSVLLEKLGIFEQEIASKNQEIDRLLSEETEKLYKVQREFEAKITRLQDLVTARESQIEKLQEEWLSPEKKQELDEQISSLTHQVAFQEEEIQRLQEGLGQLEAEEAESVEKISEFQEKVRKLQDLLAKREEQLDKVQEEWFEPAKKHELDQEIVSLKEQLGQKDQEIEKLRQEVEERVENQENQGQEEFETRINTLQNLLKERDMQLEKYKMMMESTLGSSSTEVVDLEASLQKEHRKEKRAMSDAESSSNNGSQGGWDKLESEWTGADVISPESSVSEASVHQREHASVAANITPSQVSPTISSASAHDDEKDAQIDDLKSKIISLEQELAKLSASMQESEKNLKASTFSLHTIQHILQTIGADVHDIPNIDEHQESLDLLVLHQAGSLQEQIEKLSKVLHDKKKHKEVEKERIEELNEINDDLTRRLDGLKQRLNEESAKLTRTIEEKQKSEQELEFLRDHVKTMEEVTNREVLAFEEKESELLERICMLEERFQAEISQKSEIEGRYQTQISEIHHQFQTIEGENQRLVEENSNLQVVDQQNKDQISSLQQQILTLESIQQQGQQESLQQSTTQYEIEGMKTNLVNLTQENLRLSEESTQNTELLKTVLSRLQNLHQVLHNLGATSNLSDNQESDQDIDQAIQCLVASLNEQMENVQKMVYDKHQESVGYYNKIQEFAGMLEQKSNELGTAQEQLAQANTRLAISYEEKEKHAKELGRLREHLVQMEEISTRDAIASEERETELRKRIRDLEERSSAATNTVEQSESYYQQQVAELTARISVLEEECMKLQDKVLEKEKSLVDTSKSLSNLQLVLRDLGVDHDREIKQYEEDLEEMKQELTILTKDLDEYKTRESQHLENRRFQDDTVALLKEEIQRKEKVIEELENQLEESNPMSSTQSAQSLASAAHGGHASSTYKIDDVTLRNLFLSYLTADKDKQPEIAMVMSSILGYSQEEQSRIQKSLSSSDRGWFSFIRGSAHRPGQAASAASLTEQFIRFLEQESRVAHQHATLPVQSESKPTMDLDEPPVETKPYETISDLKFILEGD